MLGVQYRSLQIHITTWNYRFGKGESLSAQAKIELFSAQHSLKTCFWYPRAAKVPNYSKAFKIVYICIYLIQTCWFLKSYIVIYIYLFIYICIYLQFLLAMQGYQPCATGKRDANWEIQVPIWINLAQQTNTRTYIVDWQKELPRERARDI